MMIYLTQVSKLRVGEFLVGHGDEPVGGGEGEGDASEDGPEQVDGGLEGPAGGGPLPQPGRHAACRQRLSTPELPHGIFGLR